MVYAKRLPFQLLVQILAFLLVRIEDWMNHLFVFIRECPGGGKTPCLPHRTCASPRQSVLGPPLTPPPGPSGPAFEGLPLGRHLGGEEGDRWVALRMAGPSFGSSGRSLSVGRHLGGEEGDRWVALRMAGPSFGSSGRSLSVGPLTFWCTALVQSSASMSSVPNLSSPSLPPSYSVWVLGFRGHGGSLTGCPGRLLILRPTFNPHLRHPLQVEP